MHGFWVEGAIGGLREEDDFTWRLMGLGDLVRRLVSGLVGATMKP